MSKSVDTGSFNNGTLQDGIFFPLPEEANWVMKEPNGVTYWSVKKPRVVICEESKREIGWSANKHPLQYKTLDGFDRVVVTDRPVDFKTTLTRTLRNAKVPSNSIAQSGGFFV